MLLISDLELLKSAVAAAGGARIVGETPVKIRGEAAAIVLLSASPTALWHIRRTPPGKLLEYDPLERTPF